MALAFESDPSRAASTAAGDGKTGGNGRRRAGAPQGLEEAGAHRYMAPL